MLKDITFGQYYRCNSIIHRLDPRIKILLLIVVFIFIFLAQGFAGLLVMTLFITIIILLTKVPIKLFLKNLKSILPIIIFTTLINLFYSKDGIVLFEIWKLKLTTGGVERAVFLALRIILLIIVGSVLTYTTTPNDLTDAIERLLSPLKFIGLKRFVHVLAMMMTIALRFIPTLIEETEKIMNAQKARGANLEEGNIFERIKALIPILIPLLISSVRHAYELAEAMECRCYNGGEGRVRMKKLRLHISDYLSCVVCLIFSSSVVVFNILI
ncbi:MAG: energy-coupling factor transporter transmembrane protein EcfT [Clostridia bacterium]|nr:energy-coupling factor transporter transmembrane protein EcfT [Clostridia bacterium]